MQRLNVKSGHCKQGNTEVSSVLFLTLVLKRYLLGNNSIEDVVLREKNHEIWKGSQPRLRRQLKTEAKEIKR